MRLGKPTHVCRIALRATLFVAAFLSMTTSAIGGKVAQASALSPAPNGERGITKTRSPLIFMSAKPEPTLDAGAPIQPSSLMVGEPALSWNTFLGGSGIDSAYDIVLDGSGNAYGAGVMNAYTDAADGFVAKLSPSGNLLWTTFLGGSAADYAYGIALDSAKNIYVAGTSYASWGAPIRAFSGVTDAFVAKLDSSGHLIWNTFLGGAHADNMYNIAVDTGGNVFVAGESYGAWSCSPVNCTKRAYSGGADAVVAMLDSSGELIWNTFLGNTNFDEGLSLALDKNGNIYVAGSSSDAWGTPVRAFSGASDAFVARLDPTGKLTWNTFLGSSQFDYGHDLALDSIGNGYIVGHSWGVWGNPLRAYQGPDDAFAAKLSASGRLLWNTFLGPGAGYSITVDGMGKAYVTGESEATWGNPVRVYQGSEDAFAAKLDPSGRLTWNTFLGGSGLDAGYAIAVDSRAHVYVAGPSSVSWGNPIRAYTVNDFFVAKVPTPVFDTFSSVGASDGWILETGENTNTGGTFNAGATTFTIGDNALKKQYRAILSFNTAGLPDTAIIAAATLKLTRQSVVPIGTNPFALLQGMMIDVRRGFFGTTVSLESVDFKAPPNIVGLGPFNPTPIGALYTVNLPSTAWSYINKTTVSSGLTQLRLRFKLDDNHNNIANYISFYSGNFTTTPSLRPTLVIKYYVP